MRRLALILHAHLPWVREREPWTSTERWFHEAMWECYLPLLRWLRSDAARLTLSISPTLAAMFGDPILRARLSDHVARVAALNHAHAPNAELRRHYEERLHPGRFDAAELPGIELMTTSLTHAFLPALSPVGGARPQLALGRACFPHDVKSMWLPECAWSSAIDRDLAALDVATAVLDEHGISLARPAVTSHGLVSPSGVAYMGRCRPACLLVWSRDQGYPGHPRYRDFYRDHGFLGGMSGLKYHRITSRDGGDKEIYNPAAAAEQIEIDAADFVSQLLQIDMDAVALAFDAELFGHWWHEGLAFLSAVVRRLQSAGIALSTLSDLAQESLPIAEPATSSWGRGGFSGDWINPRVAGLWRVIHRAHRRLVSAVMRWEDVDGDRGRALDHAIEATLLAQASDWIFMITHDEQAAYARRRIATHLAFAAQMLDVAEGGHATRSTTIALRRSRTITRTLDSGVLRAAFTSR